MEYGREEGAGGGGAGAGALGSDAGYLLPNEP